mgnify:CR=1 FL=1
MCMVWLVCVVDVGAPDVCVVCVPTSTPTCPKHWYKDLAICVLREDCAGFKNNERRPIRNGISKSQSGVSWAHVCRVQ